MEGSNFMKGLETAITMHSEDFALEDYGCEFPEDFDGEFDDIFRTITKGLDFIYPFIPKDNIEIKLLVEVFDEVIVGAKTLIVVLSEDAEELFDMYCRGIVTGFEGITTFVRVAKLFMKIDRE